MAALDLSPANLRGQVLIISEPEHAAHCRQDAPERVSSQALQGLDMALEEVSGCILDVSDAEGHSFKAEAESCSCCNFWSEMLVLPQPVLSPVEA